VKRTSQRGKDRSKSKKDEMKAAGSNDMRGTEEKAGRWDGWLAVQAKVRCFYVWPKAVPEDRTKPQRQ
jgi:hypothetical protein